MPADATTDPKFEIGHVLFIDIVGYSKLLIGEQSDLIRDLKEVVSRSERFRLAEQQGNLVSLPTGDGMALVFRDSPEAPAQCALEIAKAAKNYPQLQLRMGIHSGPVNFVTDVNGRPNIAGAGINIAQRVMDCGDAGHILVSKHVAEDLEHYARWQPHLHDFGEYEVKHGVRIILVNLYTQELGNPRIPAKLAPLRKDTISRRRTSLSTLRQIPWRVVLPLLATILVVAGAILGISRHRPIFTWHEKHNAKEPNYPHRSYAKVKWSKIYGVDQLLPVRATLQRITGWDRNDLAITGTIENQQLLILLQNGEWKVNKLEGPGAILASQFASRERLVFLRFARRGAVDLVTWDNGAYQWLGNVPPRSSLWALAPDVFCGMQDRGVYWEYSGNSVQQFDRTSRDSFILREKDAVAQIASGNRSPEPMAIINVRDVTRVGDRKAIGLWNVPQGKCAVVRYYDDRWYLVNEVAGFTWNNVPNKAWFLDENNFVAIGSDKVVRCVNGKVEFQALSIGAQEYTAKGLAAVWGHDISNYWVADLRGNVFGFDGAQWKLIAHGPELKPGQKFEAFWTAANGSVIAVTANEVYVFE